MALAARLSNLGTETAFAVSLAAADWAAKGNRVFPFHLGDINLPTPANVVEAMDKAIADGKTGYCPAAGIPRLREVLADDVGRRRGIDITPDQIVVQPGGKPVIGKFVQSVMNPGDAVLYPNPGYPIYESMIEYHGGHAVSYGYHQTSTGFAIDVDHLRSLITPATTAIIYNDLQNPLGAESSEEERQAIADLAVEHDLWVLSDEAYFEMRYSGASTSIAALTGMRDRTVILYTFSKKYAMTGWRLGAAIAPLPIADAIAKLNTNDESCTTHFVQEAGVEGITGSPDGPLAILDELRRRRDAAWSELSRIDGLVCPKPEATFYLFPDVTAVMDRLGFDEVSAFATAALHHTGVSFCTRKHFGRPQPGESSHFVRFAYSGLSADDIIEGLTGLREWIESESRLSAARIAVTGKIPAAGLALLHELGDVVAWESDDIPSAAQVHDLVRGADAAVTLLTTKVDEPFLDAAGPQLRVVANVAVGYNNIDVATCAARGVVATNTPGVLTDATADIAMALVLMATRRLGEGERVIRSGAPWQWGMFYMLGRGIQGAQLGIVGMGDIGRALARRAGAFGMSVAYTNRNRVAPEIERELDARYLSMDELLATSDVVSVNCPYSAATHHLIGAAELAAMKPSAFLVNTARGAIVDEAALVDALRGGVIAGAALDVFENEPAVHPGLLECDNAVLVPHLGSATEETRSAMAVLAADNVVRVLTGSEPRTPIPVPA